MSTTLTPGGFVRVLLKLPDEGKSTVIERGVCRTNDNGIPYCVNMCRRWIIRTKLRCVTTPENNM